MGYWFPLWMISFLLLYDSYQTDQLDWLQSKSSSTSFAVSGWNDTASGDFSIQSGELWPNVNGKPVPKATRVKFSVRTFSLAHSRNLINCQRPSKARILFTLISVSSVGIWPSLTSVKLGLNSPYEKNTSEILHFCCKMEYDTFLCPRSWMYCTLSVQTFTISWKQCHHNDSI